MTVQALLLLILLHFHERTCAFRTTSPTLVQRRVILRQTEVLPFPHLCVAATHPRQTVTAVRGVVSGTIQGFKERATYDPQFVTKLSIEMLVGFVTQMIAEVGKRGANSLAEVDFIVADLVMGLSANFAAVYLSAPTGASGAKGNADGKASATVKSFWDSCPDNAFQKTSEGRTFSLLQRFGAILKVAPKLFWIGFAAMAVGTGFTSLLSGARAVCANGLSSVAVSTSGAIVSALALCKTSIAIGAYLAVSTNLRYQIVAGIMEERVLDPLFLNMYPSKFCHGLGSFVVRTTNTFVGSAMMVDFLKWL